MASPAAPERLARRMASRSGVHSPRAVNRGEDPSSRSISAPRPLANRAPAASKAKVHGLPTSAWLALQLAATAPRAPAFAAARSVNRAKPARRKPPNRPRSPLAITDPPGPESCSERNSTRPSASRSTSAAPLGRAPSHAARRPRPAPPSPRPSAVTRRSPLSIAMRAPPASRAKAKFGRRTPPSACAPTKRQRLVSPVTTPVSLAEPMPASPAILPASGVEASIESPAGPVASFARSASPFALAVKLAVTARASMAKRPPPAGRATMASSAVGPSMAA